MTALPARLPETPAPSAPHELKLPAAGDDGPSFSDLLPEAESPAEPVVTERPAADAADDPVKAELDPMLLVSCLPIVVAPLPPLPAPPENLTEDVGASPMPAEPSEPIGISMSAGAEPQELVCAPPVRAESSVREREAKSVAQTASVAPSPIDPANPAAMTSIAASASPVTAVSAEMKVEKNEADTLLKSTPTDDRVDRAEVSGTSAAKPARDMREANVHHHLRASVAKIAASESVSAPAANPLMRLVSGVRSDRSLPSPDRLPTVSATISNENPPAAGIITPPGESAPESVRVAAPDAAAVVHQVVATSERMRVGGRERVELHVQLHSGEEVTIKLQLHEGKVEAAFHTDSDSLRQALEQGWPQLSPRSGERTARIATTVFESEHSNSGMNDLPSRQERRQPGEQAPEAAPMPRPLRTPRSVAAVRASEPAVPASVQLYA